MARTLIRPGGRSERIQIAVHKAVKDLMAERPEEELTIAMIAARADVTPSTIYRRWSSLSQLLNDVAGERFVSIQFLQIRAVCEAILKSGLNKPSMTFPPPVFVCCFESVWRTRKWQRWRPGTSI